METVAVGRTGYREFQQEDYAATKVAIVFIIALRDTFTVIDSLAENNVAMRARDWVVIAVLVWNAVVLHHLAGRLSAVTALAGVLSFAAGFLSSATERIETNRRATQRIGTLYFIITPLFMDAEPTILALHRRGFKSERPGRRRLHRRFGHERLDW